MGRCLYGQCCGLCHFFLFTISVGVSTASVVDFVIFLFTISVGVSTASVVDFVIFFIHYKCRCLHGQCCGLCHFFLFTISVGVSTVSVFDLGIFFIHYSVG